MRSALHVGLDRTRFPPNSRVKADYDEILQEVFIRFPNALPPDTVSINSVVREYAEKTSDGEWRLEASTRGLEA